MAWLKNVILDIVVFIVVVLYVSGGEPWTRWVIMIYTPFMLLLKLGAVASAGSIKPMTGQKKKVDGAPDMFFHVLYATTAVLLAYSGWWIMAAAWLAIWVASIVYLKKIQSKPSAK